MSLTIFKVTFQAHARFLNIFKRKLFWADDAINPKIDVQLPNLEAIKMNV